MPDAARRVERVLGDKPLVDLSYLLPPLPDCPPNSDDALPARVSRAMVPRELIVIANESWDAIRVWRTAYALGLRWGNLDLFHWQSPTGQTSWFCVHRLEEPAGFLPERALEGDRIRGLVFLHDPDSAADPAAVWNRILLAAAAWVRELGGLPIDRSGQPIHPWSGPRRTGLG